MHSSFRNVDQLFPTPFPAPSSLSPKTLPGGNHTSKLAVQKALKDNHVKFHAYINDMGFHK